MSENTTTEATETTEQQGDPAAEALGENGKKALKAERDRANELDKQLKAATAKLTEIERANETAIERAHREAQEARAAAEKVPTLVADRLRDYLATIHGISDEDRELYLTSSDPDVLLKQAAGLAARTTQEAAPGPRPDLTQGGSAGGGDHALNGDPLLDDLKSKLGIA